MVKVLTLLQLNSVFISNGNAAELEHVKSVISRKLAQILGEDFDEGRILVLLRLKTPQEATIWSICLYVSRSMSEDERIRVSDASIKS
ncbi:hypothetical protein COOONC_18224 [Cooperia oncophora]